MLVRHSTIYLLGRVFPALASLAALALFTRLLTKEQYGYYALVLASVGVLNAALFQWMSLSVGRFLPATQQPDRLLSTSLVSYALMTLLVLAVGCATAYLWPVSALRLLILAPAVLACAQAWFDLNQQIANIQLKPTAYGIVSSAKALLGLVLGMLFFYAGLGVVGILTGLFVALVVSPMILMKHWRGVSVGGFCPRELRRLFAYGAPLTLTFLLIFVVNFSDRFLLGYFRGPASVGVYAPAYDLTQQTLGMLMNTVHLAAFPLAVTALEAAGVQAAQGKLRQTALVLLGVSAPAALGMILLAPNIAYVFLGRQFRAHSDALIAIISLATLLSGVRAYYYDYSFQLGERLGYQVWVFFAAALANLCLNIWWIPLYGVLGAAYATLMAFFVALIVSGLLGRRAFVLPKPPTELVKLAPACVAMVVGLYFVRHYRGLLALAGQVALGTLVYGAVLWVLNYGGLRTWAANRVLRTSVRDR